MCGLGHWHFVLGWVGLLLRGGSSLPFLASHFCAQARIWACYHGIIGALGAATWRLARAAFWPGQLQQRCRPVVLVATLSLSQGHDRVHRCLALASLAPVALGFHTPRLTCRCVSALLVWGLSCSDTLDTALLCWHPAPSFLGAVLAQPASLPHTCRRNGRLWQGTPPAIVSASEISVGVADLGLHSGPWMLIPVPRPRMVRVGGPLDGHALQNGAPAPGGGQAGTAADLCLGCQASWIWCRCQCR